MAAINVFVSLGTQWRTGFNGATGLDYNALPTVLRLCAVPRADWPEIFDNIRTLEDAALEVMRSKK